MTQRVAIIIGAGPAGLTAAYELLKRTDVKPIILERSEYMGGIARTVSYKGNRIDIGGHRFFSKSDRVMNWWFQFLPVQTSQAAHTLISYHQKTREIHAQETGDPEKTDLVMLVRQRKSRIYFLRRFFDYPISLSRDTIQKLGLARTLRIGLSYMQAVVRPIRNEQNLEQFFRLIPRRYGVSPARRSVPSGVRSESRASRSPRPSRTICAKCVATSRTWRRRNQKPHSSNSSFIPSWGRASFGRRSPGR
jgi:hypothetical protein